MLLKTKLFVPRLQAGLVPRPRLLELLDEGLSGKLTLVAAPAGFGKSTLLSEWSLRSVRPVAWVSLDAQDDNPVRFWTHVVGAISTLHPCVGSSLLAGLVAQHPELGNVWLSALINEMVAVPGETALVLDDYHLIENEEVHRGLGFMLDHLPPRMSVVIAARHDPPLPLAQLRARSQLTEVRADDLRLSEEEVAGVLRGVTGSEPSLVAVRTIGQRTEGWVAGVQLAGLSLRGRSDAGSFLDTLSGTSRHIFDYLGEEVVQRQPDDVVAFLLRTSILDRLTAELCDQVAGSGGAQQMLERLERANLFIVPLDDRREWYRYHHLFGDVLRRRLTATQPDLVRVLHRRASRWYAEHGVADPAVRHALAAGDPERAADLIERHAEDVHGAGQLTTLATWLQSLPSEIVRGRPGLLLCSALVLTGRGRFGEVEELLDATEQGFHRLPSGAERGGWLANLPGSVLALRATMAFLAGDVQLTIEMSRAALAELPADDRFLRVASLSGVAHGTWMSGELEEAKALFGQLVAQSHQRSTEYLGWLAFYGLGRIALVEGRLGEAEQLCRDALERAGSTRAPLAGIAGLIRGEVLRERDELDDAARQVLDGIELCAPMGNVRLMAFGYVSLSRVRHALGDAAGAEEALALAEQHVLSGPATVRLAVSTWRARLQLDRGDIVGARRWARDAGLPDAPLSFGLEEAHIHFARVLRAEGRIEEAQALLERLLAAAERGGRDASALEVLVLLARCHGDRGDPDAARAVACRAIALGEPEGYVRVFADEGPAIGALLQRVLMGQRRRNGAEPVPLAYTARLLEACRGSGPEPSAPAELALPVPLTERELEVLRLIASGQSNAQIAGRIYVAHDTVKKHVSHVFDKLSVGNRTEAVARARQLGLLP